MVMTDVVVKYIYEGHDDCKYICCAAILYRLLYTMERLLYTNKSTK